MKKGILALIVTALVGGGMNLAMADSDHHDGKRHEYGDKTDKGCDRHGMFRLEKMREKLGLSDEQVQTITSIRERYQPRLQELREKSRANRMQLREVKHADSVDMEKVKTLARTQGDLKAQKIILKAEMHNEIHGVFTKEQLSKVKELKQKRHEYRNHEEHEHQGKDD